MNSSRLAICTAVEHQYLAEEGVLEQQQVLVRGACLVMDLVDTITHAEAEFVEQRFGDPSFVGHDRSRALRSAKWVAAEKETAGKCARPLTVVKPRDPLRRRGRAKSRLRRHALPRTPRAALERRRPDWQRRT